MISAAYVGQAAQPILSVNYGSHNWERIRETLRYALYTVAFFSVAWTISIWAVPNGFIRVLIIEEKYEASPETNSFYTRAFLYN